jgi:hypothetical protein
LFVGNGSNFKSYPLILLAINKHLKFTLQKKSMEISMAKFPHGNGHGQIRIQTD